MTARLARLASVTEEIRPNRPIRQNRSNHNKPAAPPLQPVPSGRLGRRKELRYATGFDAILESSRGESAQVLLCEISMHGCRVKCDEAWLRTGAFVSIALEDEPPLQAIVRWNRDGAAGMEFLKPIPAERGEWRELLDMPF